MTFKFVVRFQNWQRTRAFCFDFPECKKTAPSWCLPSSKRAHWSACCSAQEDSWGLVCGCSRFQAVAGDWEKRGEHSQIKHNSQEMSQNTCERSEFAKYKPRVQYFDLTTQKKVVMESEEKRFWGVTGDFGIKGLSSWSSSPPGLSDASQSIFRTDMEKFWWSPCLNIKLRHYLSLAYKSREITSAFFARFLQSS